MLIAFAGTSKIAVKGKRERAMLSAEKSLSLKAERGVSFEEVLSAISQGGLLGVLDHPNRAKYGHQKMLVVRIRDYAYLVSRRKVI